MVKGLLRVFGFISVLCGIGAVAGGFLGKGLLLSLLPWGLGAILSGALLLGFAYGLELLEDIASNTAAKGPAGPR